MPIPATLSASLMRHVDGQVVGWLGYSLETFPDPLQAEVRANAITRYTLDQDADAAARECVRIVCDYVLNNDSRYNPAMVDRASEVAIRLRPAHQAGAHA